MIKAIDSRFFIRILILIFLFNITCTDTSDVLEQMKRPEVSYIGTPVPPCDSIPGYQIDPCPSGIPSFVESTAIDSGWPTWVSSGVFPSYTDVLLGFDHPRLAIHLVVRGVVLPESTRCDSHSIELYDYEHSVWSFEGGYHYNCFVEVKVREYIVGQGPQTLPVIVHREALSGYEIDDSNKNRIRILVSLDDPEGRISTSYEGKEMVLFLAPSATMSVEAWRAVRSSTSFWFVQRRDGVVRVVSPDIVWADTAEERAALDMPLADLVKKVKAADVERRRLTGGRVGITGVDGAVSGDGVGEGFPAAQGVRAGVTLPMLVTDANKLQAYYVAAGAVYEGEGKTTVLPPRPPDGFVPPSTTVASSTTSSSSTSVGSTSTTVVGSSTTSTTSEASTTTSSQVEQTTTSTASASTTTAGTVPAGLSISVSDASATEGEWLELVVTLSEEPLRNVSVDYDVRDVTAVSGVDFQSPAGTFSFGAFDTLKTIRVRLFDDSLSEGTETFEIVLSGSRGAPIAKSVGTGTILDND